MVERFSNCAVRRAIWLVIELSVKHLFAGNKDLQICPIVMLKQL